ncbi:MAG: DUF881 domain-containing protein [Candidatus Gastranaerophilales bacterium]|nr:DUF881 domain-containing protein [Candidatus Gastranaerophilales bacterium]
MKFHLSEEGKFKFFIFMIGAIVSSIITMQLVRYSGYAETDSAMVKKIESLATLLKESNQHNEELSSEVLKLEKEIFELKHGISPNGTSKQVREMYQLAGFTDVIGNGAIITITENNAKMNEQKDYANILQSDDLLRLINVLKSAGATAISVNNQRLVVTSEITNAENCIVINKKKISPPYIIKVIGDFDAINSSLKIRGGIVEYLSLFSIDVKIDKKDKITINSY